jgi:hypothetical protein
VREHGVFCARHRSWIAPFGTSILNPVRHINAAALREVCMKRLMPVVFCSATILGFLAGYAVSPAGLASGQTAAPQAPLAGALPPGDYSKMNIAPDQGEPVLFSGAALKKAHPELQARAKNGQVVANPRDLMPPLVTRTHWFTL